MSPRANNLLMHDELRAAWRTNNAINLLLLDRISDEGLGASLSTRGGRGVAGEFAHMHNIRVWHLEKRVKGHKSSLEKYDTKEPPTRKQLMKAFKASGDAVENLLLGVLDARPGYKGFKKGVFTSLAYFISHEAHHRGRILLTLKVSKNTLDKATQSGIWAWDQL